jgi:F0F1-type ATP synthase delta subunit
MEGLLITAVPMDRDIVAKIESKFSEKMGFPVHLSVEVDPSLIAGFVVSIQHHRYDYSARARLMDIKKHLLND